MEKVTAISPLLCIINLDALCFVNQNYKSQDLPPLLKQSIFFFLEKQTCELAFSDFGWIINFGMHMKCRYSLLSLINLLLLKKHSIH